MLSHGEVFWGRLRNLWARIVVEKEDFVLFPTSNRSDTIQLPELDFGGNSRVC